MNKEYTFDDLIDLIESGREVEFVYEGNKYSITYYPDGCENEISFTQFYLNPNDYKDLNDFIKNGKWGENTIKEIWNNASDIYVF